MRVKKTYEEHAFASRPEVQGNRGALSLGRRKRTKFRLKKRFFILIGLLGYVVFSFGQQYYQIRQMDQELSRFLQEKNRLLAEQNQLEAELALLDNPFYIEKVAREDLGLIKEGETLLVPGKAENLPEVKTLNELSDNIH